MTLKEVILKRYNINFVTLDINALEGESIACNVSKNESGNYKIENPELEIEDLDSIDFEEVEEIRYFKTDDGFNGVGVCLNEDTIKKNKDANKVYKELYRLLIRDYKELAESYSKEENKYSNPLKCTSGTLAALIFFIIGMIIALTSSQGAKYKYLWLVIFGSAVLLVIAIWIMAMIDCKNKYLKNKALREKNEAILNSLLELK